jgi:hypothetical protein
MNQLILAFKQCAHQAGQTCGLTNGYLVRRLGLGDFLENKLKDDDTAPDIVVKALEFFCADILSALLPNVISSPNSPSHRSDGPFQIAKPQFSNKAHFVSPRRPLC